MKRLSLAVSALLVCAVAYRVFVFRYWEPANFTWDEKYHIASAQKYLNGVFFMEPHAPLGKLLIGLGEYVLDANPDDSQFIATDHASSALR